MNITFVTGSFDVKPNFETNQFAIVSNENLKKRLYRKYSIFFKGDTSAPLVAFVKTIKDGKEIINFFEENCLFDYSMENLKKVYMTYKGATHA